MTNLNALTALGRALCKGPICSQRKHRPCEKHVNDAEWLLDSLLQEGYVICEVTERRSRSDWE